MQPVAREVLLGNAFPVRSKLLLGYRESTYLFEVICVAEVQSGSVAEAVQQTAWKAEVECPMCGSRRPHRMERRCFFQVKVLPVFGYYPWLCGVCRTSFLTRKRYRKKTK